MGRQLRAALLAVMLGGLASAGASTNIEAQTPKQSMRIGLIAYGEGAMGPHLYRSLIEGLRKQGYIEGRNLIVERRYADGPLREGRCYCKGTSGAEARCHLLGCACHRISRPAKGCDGG